MLAGALAEAPADADVVVVDASPARLEQLERDVRDPRVWFLLGDPSVIPLPDRSVDVAIGVASSDELERVRR